MESGSGARMARKIPDDVRRSLERDDLIRHVMRRRAKARGVLIADVMRSLRAMARVRAIINIHERASPRDLDRWADDGGRSA